MDTGAGARVRRVCFFVNQPPNMLSPKLVAVWMGRLASRLPPVPLSPKSECPAHTCRARCLPESHDAASSMAFHHVDARESALMKSLHADGCRLKKIAALVKRITDILSKHVFKENHMRASRPKLSASTDS